MHVKLYLTVNFSEDITYCLVYVWEFDWGDDENSLFNMMSAGITLKTEVNQCVILFHLQQYQ